MKKGDIILLPFPFTDLSGSKNPPPLILIESELDIAVAFYHNPNTLDRIDRYNASTQ